MSNVKAQKEKSIGENIKYSIDDDGILHIEIDLNEKGSESNSGKSMIVASTKGNKPMGDTYAGINVYRYVSKKEDDKKTGVKKKAGK